MWTCKERAMSKRNAERNRQKRRFACEHDKNREAAETAFKRPLFGIGKKDISESQNKHCFL